MNRSIFTNPYVLIAPAFLLAGFWVALFDRRGQTLHDKLTSTFVVRMT